MKIIKEEIKSLWIVLVFIYERLCEVLSKFYIDEIKKIYAKAIISAIIIIIVIFIYKNSGTSERIKSKEHDNDK